MYNLIQFLYDEIFYPIREWFTDLINTTNLNEKIVDGTLININMTWYDLIDTLLPTITAIILIILFIKFIVKLLGIFVWK